MGTTLAVSTLLVIWMVYIGPRGFTSRDPATVGGLALILSPSRSLRSQLSNHGSSDIKEIKGHLQEVQCRSVLSSNGEQYQLHVELIPGEINLEASFVSTAIDISSDAAFWRPISLQPAFKLFVIASLLTLVAILEIVHSISQKHDGLVQVNTQSYERFGWAYIPAIVMLIAQVIVGMISFSSVLIFPYFLLRTQFNTRNDMLRDYTTQTAIESAFRSLPKKHFPVLSMALAMLLSPLLTVAVSGIYTAQTIETQMEVTLSTMNQLSAFFYTPDWWTLLSPVNDLAEWHVPVLMMAFMGDAKASEQTTTNIGLLLTQDVPYPPGTYDELAFPETKLNVPQALSKRSDALAGSVVIARIPAVRAELSCSSGPGHPKNFSNLEGSISGHSVVNGDGCLGFLWDSPGSNAFGYFQIAGYDSSSFGTAFCGAYGVSELNWRTFWCSSVVNQLDVDVRMDASTLAVHEAKPDEGTSRIFANYTQPSDSWYPNNIIPPMVGSASSSEFGHSFYDTAFQAVIRAAGFTDDLKNFPIADYMDDDGFKQIEKHLRYIYRIVVAQAANVMTRVPFNKSALLAPPASIPAKLVNTEVYRLKQSTISTRILDGLLVTIALCIAVSFWLMDTRRILYKNPASIAAGASLVAGDPDLLRPENLPEGAQWCSDAELEKKGVWSGCVFSLGWWETEDPAAGLVRRFGLDMGKTQD